MHLSKFCSASFLFCTMRLLRCFQYSLNASFFSLLYLVTPWLHIFLRKFHLWSQQCN
jgi:hypothetical protein